MSIKAYPRTDSQGNITVYLEGGLDYDTISVFKKRLELLLKSNPGRTITLDLYKLDFVGSSGIAFFIETIREISQQNDYLKLSNMRNEFRKIFTKYGVNLSDIIAESPDPSDEPPFPREKKLL